MTSRCWSARIWSRSSARTFASRAESGSSSSSTRGSMARARPARRAVVDHRKVGGGTSRRARPVPRVPAVHRRERDVGTARLVTQLQSEGHVVAARSCWGRASNSGRPCPCRASAPGCAPRPCRRPATRPMSGRSNPASTRSAVVLPQPDGPSSATNSPGSMLSEKPSSALRRAEASREVLEAATGAPLFGADHAVVGDRLGLRYPWASAPPGVGRLRSVERHDER